MANCWRKRGSVTFLASRRNLLSVGDRRKRQNGTRSDEKACQKHYHSSRSASSVLIFTDTENLTRSFVLPPRKFFKQHSGQRSASGVSNLPGYAGIRALTHQLGIAFDLHLREHIDIARRFRKIHQLVKRRTTACIRKQSKQFAFDKQISRK